MYNRVPLHTDPNAHISMICSVFMKEILVIHRDSYNVNSQDVKNYLDNHLFNEDLNKFTFIIKTGKTDFDLSIQFLQYVK
jgi:hypothetical protein